MTERNFSQLIDELNAAKASGDNDLTARLEQEIEAHPVRIAGKKLPPIVGYMGTKPAGWCDA